MLENVYLLVLPSLLSTCFVPLSNVLGTRDIDEREQAEGRARLRTHLAVHHAWALGFAMACSWSDSSHAKAIECTKEIRKGNPHCWLKFSEWNEFKTENNDLNPRGPVRYFSLWTCWGLVFSSLSYLTLAFYLFLRKYCHFLSAHCAPGTILTPHQPITLTCTLLIRRPRPWITWPRSCHSDAFCCRLSQVMFWNT